MLVKGAPVFNIDCQIFLRHIRHFGKFHHDDCDYFLNFYGHSFIFNYTFRLSVTRYFWFWDFYGNSIHFELHIGLSVTSWFYAPPRMFLPQGNLFEYWIACDTFGLLYVKFTFPTRIFYRGVQDFATNCPCGVWCHDTCLLYVDPLFGNLVWYDSGSVSVT